MDTQKLRQRILDLAIRGKLLPQDPNDEPASVLLDRIRAEKERLIAEGKLKRPKAKKSTDKSHYQQFTPPFDIPDSWEWVRLGDVCDVARGGSPRPIKSYLTYRVDGINWIKIGDTEKDGKFINSTKERIIPEGALKSRLVHKGDFLLTNSMSFGRPYILNIDGCIHDGWLVISPIGNVFDKDFLYLLLSSEYAYYQFSEKASGSAVSNLNSDKVAESIFPLPPLETQRIIVRECEKLTSFAQTIDNEKKDLEITIALTKSKILDLAMQGKLVPQDPADEPAADMLRRVNPKAKIITDNPQCRNLPLGWTLCQLRDLCSFLSRGKSPKYSETPNQYPVFAQKCNLKDGDISLTQARFLDENTISKWPEKYRLRDGDVLVNSTGTGTVGRTRMFKSEYLGNYPFVVPDSHVSVVRSFDEIDSTYIFYCLYCQDGQQYFAENLAGSTNQKELYIDVIGDKSIMLPPINEQKRIVAKIEEQYSVLYEIEASLRS